MAESSTPRLLPFSKISGGIVTSPGLESIRVEQAHAELRVVFDFPSQLLLPQAASQVPGWLPFVEERVETISDEKNTVRLRGEPLGSLGGFLPQSIDAKSYRGKRVRLVAELGTHPDANDRAGLFLWASGQQDQSLTFNSRSIDGKSDITKQMTAMNRQDYLHDTEVKWRSMSIELNVPSNSQVLSFGAYTKNASLRVRKVHFEIIGDEDDSVSADKPWLPHNLFVIPGYPIPIAPRNLDFSEPMEAKSSDAEQVADKKSDSDAVRR